MFSMPSFTDVFESLESSLKWRKRRKGGEREEERDRERKSMKKDRRD
jgi:hypothetical protein